MAFFVLLLLLADSTPSGASSIPLIGTVVPQLATHIIYPFYSNEHYFYPALSITRLLA